MKRILQLFIFLILSIALLGCSSSGETEKDEMPPPPPVVEKKVEPPPPPLVKQKPSDTVNVEVKEAEKPQYEPTQNRIQDYSDKKYGIGNFAVQIGAYKMPDNADRIAATAKERFNMNVFTSFDDVEKLYKVYLGDFETKDAARTFRDVMASKYPDDYKDAWVSEKPK